ncbi:hypothetical protein FRC11_009757 [Ceratobasidium sp. 423]|nr:hypothetical protein FRC11_009757 [Ceratobasidium sp. 423]
MMGSESEGGPRRSKHNRLPMKKIAQHDEEMAKKRSRHENSEVKKTIAQKHKAGTGLKLIESGQPRLPAVPEQSASSTEPSQAPTAPERTPQTPAKAKKVSKPIDPQSAQAVVKGGRVISPEKEGRPGKSIYPGPRPTSGVLIKDTSVIFN